MSFIYLPNILSVARLFLVPVIIWLIVADALLVAFFVFLLAGLTDGIDGYLARQFRWETELGAYLDPVADKALLVSVFGALGFLGELPAWLVIMAISRDVLIVGAVLLSWLMGRSVAVHPLLISKINTTCQIILAALVLGEGGLELGWTMPVEVMIWMTGLTTALSAGVYLVSWMQRMAYYDLQERRERSDSASGDTD